MQPRIARVIEEYKGEILKLRDIWEQTHECVIAEQNAQESPKNA